MKLALPRQPECNIGTAGHVDHGKTTLVEALTGVWTSRHSEELRRGITIRVGYADAAIYRCEGCEPPEAYATSPRCPSCGREAKLLRVVSFVDCPGHEALMTNMLSGAALMDGALLLIAANEKVPQPQTREHLMALEMLGIRNIVIVQNKLDLVTKEQALENYRAIREFVKGSIAEGAPVVPISAQHRLNIEAVLQAMEERIPTPPRDPKARPLLPVLRSFDVNRPGTPVGELRGGVIGGSILQGMFRPGDEIEVRPGIVEDGKAYPLYTKVTSIGTSAGLVEEARPGGLIALGTGLDPSLTKADRLVGCIVGIVNELPPTFSRAELEVSLFEVAVGDPELRKVQPLQRGELLRLNIGTAAVPALVKQVARGRIEAELKRPVCAPQGARVAVSRRIGEKWRLIGSGKLLG